MNMPIIRLAKKIFFIMLTFVFIDSWRIFSNLLHYKTRKVQNTLIGARIFYRKKPGYLIHHTNAVDEKGIRAGRAIKGCDEISILPEQRFVSAIIIATDIDIVSYSPDRGGIHVLWTIIIRKIYWRAHCFISYAYFPITRRRGLEVVYDP